MPCRSATARAWASRARGDRGDGVARREVRRNLHVGHDEAGADAADLPVLARRRRRHRLQVEIDRAHVPSSAASAPFIGRSAATVPAGSGVRNAGRGSGFAQRGIFPINSPACASSTPQIAARADRGSHPRADQRRHLPAGSQLPLQKELAHHFGVSVSRRAREPRAAGGRRPRLEPRRARARSSSDDADAALRFPMWMREPSSPQELAECARGARPARAHRRRARRESAATPRTSPGCAPRSPTSRRPRPTPRPTPAPTWTCTWRSRTRPTTGPLAGALAALRRSIPGVIALRAHEAIADSSIDKVIDDYRQLVGAIELGDERRALRALDRMFARSRALARELGLYPDDERR